MLIKRDKRDSVFSELIRLRAEWACERCSKVFPSRIGLECSHVFSRRHRASRWLPDNVFSLCRPCHRYLSENPVEHAYFAREKLGDTRFDLLRERVQTSRKYTKRDLAEIYQHYKEELKRLQALRAEGERGYLEIISYD